MKISPSFSARDLWAEVFVQSPTGEPAELSLARLTRAIERDGLWRTYNAASVWWAYRHHPELSRELKACKPR